MVTRLMGSIRVWAACRPIHGTASKVVLHTGAILDVGCLQYQGEAAASRVRSARVRSLALVGPDPRTTAQAQPCRGDGSECGDKRHLGSKLECYRTAKSPHHADAVCHRR
jgi:hypothetical protein